MKKSIPNFMKIIFRLGSIFWQNFTSVSIILFEIWAIKKRHGRAGPFLEMDSWHENKKIGFYLSLYDYDQLQLVIYAKLSFRWLLLNYLMLRSLSVFSLMLADIDRQLNYTSNKTKRSKISLFIKKLLHFKKWINFFFGSYCIFYIICYCHTYYLFYYYLFYIIYYNNWKHYAQLH